MFMLKTTFPKSNNSITSYRISQIFKSLQGNINIIKSKTIHPIRSYSNVIPLTEKQKFRLKTELCDYSLISFSKEFMDSKFSNLKNDIFIYPEFISEDESNILLEQIEKKIKRYCREGYSKHHFDEKIDKYKEFSSHNWLPAYRSMHSRTLNSEEVINNLKNYYSPNDLAVIKILDKVWSLFPKSWAWIAPHVLDLNTGGNIKAHVDNPDYSGLYVGGISLLSSSVSTFRHISDPNICFDVLLPPKSLYFFSNGIRYEFTHEITSTPEQRRWNNQNIPNNRRISIMFRDVNEESLLKVDL
ncbi:hypothetical protein BB561_005616 [Smittium simulii]|uniref:Alpha-ketoglutarate-dependent dioxygenase AlkB-like domain-containing protein n=1 Tax=Smittium simulii TaxID=133385 RepID=A0A2T9Y9H7_9FUNG|nr:hypothetical protein BB561_005616 [Smittium simulii]